MRHGQTTGNIEDQVCGVIDVPLTELGHRQAIEAGREFCARGLSADEILCSPLSRAAETARHISEITGIPVRAEPLLTEQNFGRFEATPRSAPEFREAKKRFVDRYGSGESMLQVAHRVYGLLDRIRAESEEKTYILVAHGGIARMVESYFRDMTNEEFASYAVKNCAILRYDFP